jgi:hypothetical protein
MKEIPLTRGKVALVDDADYARISQFKWYAHVNRAGNWYAVRGNPPRVKPHLTQMHHAILGVEHSVEVDHEDGNGLNNQQKNLRVATRTQNNYNRRKFSKHKTSRYRGVCWDTQLGFWRAGMKSMGKYHFIGLFDNEEEAARAWDTAVGPVSGGWARLNFPNKV